MKKVLFAFALCMSSAAFAQVLDVASVNQVAIPENSDAVVAGISPMGDYILVTNAQKTGLSKYDLSTGQTTVITDAPGAGYDVKVSTDGKSIVYRETTYKNRLRRSAVKQHNLATGDEKTLVKATRDLQGVAVRNNVAIAVKGGKMQVKALGDAKAKVEAPALSIKNGQLMITRGGKSEVFSPNGTQFSYIWPSLSPDGEKVLYYVCGRGAYVCDLSGNNVKYLGHFSAPKWYNSEVVVAMDNKDNGEYVTSSSIVAVSLDGETQVLTGNDVIAMYPYSTLQGDKITFSTPEGKAYIININVKK